MIKYYNFRYLKLSAAIISFIIITINLIILAKFPCIGYSINIYSQINSFYWYNSIALYFLGTFIIFNSFNSSKLIGCIVIVLNYCQNFLIPYFSGYFCYGNNDEISHLGEIGQIISIGHIDATNIYPATHLVYAFASFTSSIDPHSLSYFMPALFSLLFIIGIFLYSKLFFINNKILSSILIPSITIYYLGFYHFSIVPNYVFFTLIPILFYLILNNYIRRSVSISVILVLFMIVITFGHPFIFILIIYLLIFLFVKGIFLRENHTIRLIGLGAFTFLTWLIYNLYFLGSAKKLFGSFIEGRSIPGAILAFDKLSILSLSNVELAQFTGFNLGRIIIPIAIIIIFLLSYRKYGIINIAHASNLNILFMMIVVSAFYDLMLLLNPIIAHGPIRTSNLLNLVPTMVPLFVISIYGLFFSKKITLKNILLVSLLLTLIFSLSMFGSYFSPYLYRPNIATTYNEVEGMHWLFNQKNTDPIYGLLGFEGYRYSDLFFGWSETNERKRQDIKHKSQGKVQDHFGYDYTNLFNENNKYIVITDYARSIYTGLYQKISRFTLTDFNKFNNDPNVDKIYCSLNIVIYKS